MSRQMQPNPVCRAEFHWFFPQSPWAKGTWDYFKNRNSAREGLVFCGTFARTHFLAVQPKGKKPMVGVSRGSPFQLELEIIAAPEKDKQPINLVVLKIVATIFALYPTVSAALSQKIPRKGCRGKCYPHTHRHTHILIQVQPILPWSAWVNFHWRFGGAKSSGGAKRERASAGELNWTERNGESATERQQKQRSTVQLHPLTTIF